MLCQRPGGLAGGRAGCGATQLRHHCGTTAAPLQHHCRSRRPPAAAPLLPHHPLCCAYAVYNNGKTYNFQRFLYLVSQQLDKSAAGGGSTATANAVHLARLILKDLIEQLSNLQLLGFVELPPAAVGTPPPPGRTPPAELAPAAALALELSDLYHGTLVHTLAHAALGALSTRGGLTAGDYLVQLETMQLLLVLCSTQLYATAARGLGGEHPFLEAIMQQGDAANPVVEALLHQFIASPAVPLSLKIYMPTDTRGVLQVGLGLGGWGGVGGMVLTCAPPTCIACWPRAGRAQRGRLGAVAPLPGGQLPDQDAAQPRGGRSGGQPPGGGCRPAPSGAGLPRAAGGGVLRQPLPPGAAAAAG